MTFLPSAGTLSVTFVRPPTHLMPSSEARTRKAVDRVLLGAKDTADGLATAYEPD